MTPVVQAISSHLRGSGNYEADWPSLSLHRRLAPTEPLECIYGLSLAATVQGGKQVMLGDQVLTNDPGHSMLTKIDLPVISHVSRASPDQPYLGMLLKLDARLIALKAGELGLPAPSKPEVPVSIERIDDALLGALHRLLGLLDQPSLLRHLGPLIEAEIAIRLLTGPHGLHLRWLLTADTPQYRISGMIAWLKLHYAETVHIDELASRVHMSPSSFRQHFRATTGKSPVQFQKELRLQEARRLMMNESIDPARAAKAVGYESVSQFSREYGRTFGAPPSRDTRHMRSGRKETE